MKHLLKFFAAFVLILSCSTSANARNTIEGVWELLSQNGRELNSNEKGIKTIFTDGTYTVLWSSNAGKTYNLMQKGVYRHVAPGIYVEFNERHSPSNASVAINYEFPAKDQLKITYKWSQSTMTQTYRRIKSDIYKTSAKAYIPSISESYAPSITVRSNTCTSSNLSADNSAVKLLRGINTSANSPRPLVFLDGQVISMADLEKIPADNISSISVRKDADAIKQYSERYGERAANGVIIVQTK